MFGKRAAELLREVVDILPEHLPAYNVSVQLSRRSCYWEECVTLPKPAMRLRVLTDTGCSAG